MQLRKTTMQYNVTTASCGCILNAIKLNYKHISFYKSTHCSFAWYSIKYFEDITLFSAISDFELSLSLSLKQTNKQTNKGKKIKFKVLTKKNILTNHDLIDKLNNSMDDPEPEMFSSKYYEPNKMASLINNTNKHFYFFRLNISSLPFHFEELSTLIIQHNLNFGFLGILESRLKLNQNPLTSIQLPGYNIEYTPTECNNGRTLLC